MDQQTKNIFKSKLYENFARIGKALGNARRLEILDLLAQAEHSVEALSEKTTLSIASVSQHLQVLKSARLVSVRREGTYAYYSLANQEVLKVWQAVSELAQTHLLEIDNLMQTYYKERNTVESITVEDLAKLKQNGKFLIIDARPADEYQAGHIPGAISIPLEDLEAKFNNIDPNTELVAYCRTSYCLLSDELSLHLLSKGYQVRKLEAGMSGWIAAGYPVETLKD